jgi:hypothetical protein
MHEPSSLKILTILMPVVPRLTFPIMVPRGDDHHDELEDPVSDAGAQADAAA